MVEHLPTRCASRRGNLPGLVAETILRGELGRLDTDAQVIGADLS